MRPGSRTWELVERWVLHLRQVRGLAEGTVGRYRRAVGRALVGVGACDEVARVEAGGADGRGAGVAGPGQAASEAAAGAVGAEDEGGAVGAEAVTEDAAVDLEEIEFNHLEHHLRDLFVAGLSESTRSGAVAALRSFFEFLVLVGEQSDNPARHLRGPRVYRREADTLTQTETTRLVYGPRPGYLPGDWKAARDQVLVAVSFVCGLRVSEVGRLRLADVGHQEGTGRWSVLVRRAKRSAEDVRLEVRDPKVGRMLGAWLGLRTAGGVRSPALFPPQRGRSQQLSSRQVQRVFQEVVEEAGIERRGRRLTFHVLRHTLATLAHQAGWEVRAVQGLLRHRSVQTTMRYVHTSEGRVGRLWRERHPLVDRRTTGATWIAQELLESR